ncbi:MAG: hypothetical protein SGBAC_008273, partial [Bacillariaceae sp.]
MGGGRGRDFFGGRGHNPGRGNGMFFKKKQNQSLEKKFNPYTTSGGKQYTTYAMVKKKIILKAKKDLRYPEDTRIRENTEFSIDYTEDIKEFKRRVTIFSENKGKVHAIIIEEFCTDLMVDKLKEDPNFDTILTDDYTKLLKKIKEIMYSSTDATNPFWSLSETLGRFLNMKQSSHKTLYAYRIASDKKKVPCVGNATGSV